jgi:hypothetical protein
MEGPKNSQVSDEGFIISTLGKGQGETASVPLWAAPCPEAKPEGFAEGKRAERAVSLSPQLRQAMVDNRGNPRLAKARDYFLPLDVEKLDELEGAFGFWQNFDEYALLKGENSRMGKTKFVAVKAAKRGNDVYARRLDEKLGFLNRLEKTQLFSISDFKTDHKVQTRLLWVTWSWDSKICTLDQSWRGSYGDLHRWKANIENRYGKLEWLVFPQAFPGQGAARGYFHAHGLILMCGTQFSVFPSMEKDHDGREILRYRIHEKKEFAAQGKWHSFVDVQALSSVQAAANYCRKYAQKVCSGSSEKAMINSAVSWIYRKKGFSLTREFREKLRDLIELLQDRKGVFQADLDGKRVKEWTWECLGVFPATDLHVNYGEWVVPIDPSLANDVLRSRKGQLFQDAWDEGGAGLRSGGGGSSND